MLALLDYRVRGCVLAVWNSRHLMYGYTVDIHFFNITYHVHMYFHV